LLADLRQAPNAIVERPLSDVVFLKANNSVCCKADITSLIDKIR
jgi:hypothetical protein